MKFGQALRDGAADEPGLLPLFELYKSCKKLLKAFCCSPTPQQSCSLSISRGGAAAGWHNAISGGEAADPPASLAAFEAAFASHLATALTSLNEWFMDQEEEAIIQLELLSTAVPACAGSALLEAGRRLADFHGHLLLLQHWSLLAYVAIVKILKKYRKRMGVPLHAPWMDGLLRQPFCSLEVVSNMLDTVQAQISTVRAVLGVNELQQHSELDACPSSPGASAASGSSDVHSGSTDASHTRLRVAHWDNAAMQRAAAALQLWQRLGATAITPSTAVVQPVLSPGWGVAEMAGSAVHGREAGCCLSDSAQGQALSAFDKAE